MELLLLLSAFLSALTGAITGARPPEVRSHQTAIEARVSVAQPLTVRAIPSIVHAAPLALAEVARFGVHPIAALAAPIPLYAARRRE